VTTLRIFRTGGVKGTSWSVAAAIAICPGLRLQTERTPVPRPTRSVRTAASASSTVVSCAQVSGRKKPS